MKSWFAYDRRGQPLGTTAVTSLVELAKITGQDLPEMPLRDFCHDAGAKYCYDVDWTQMVERVDSPAAVFLSRPLDVFLRQAVLPSAVASRLYREAFAEAPNTERMVRTFHLVGDGLLLAAVRPDGLQLRWRLGPGGPWFAQSFGADAGGTDAARLWAVMDLEQDGRPELILQVQGRAERGGTLVDLTDEVHLVRLTGNGDEFTTLTKLTVHEY